MPLDASDALTADEADALRQLVALKGVVRASAEIGVSRAAIERGIARLPIRRGTALLLRLAIKAALRRAAKVRKKDTRTNRQVSEQPTSVDCTARAERAKSAGMQR